MATQKARPNFRTRDEWNLASVKSRSEASASGSKSESACRALIGLKFQFAGWRAEPHSIVEQRSFTDGRIYGSVATLHAVKLTLYTAEKARTFCISVGTAHYAVRAVCSGGALPFAAARTGTSQRDVPTNRGRAQAPMRGIDFPRVVAEASQRESDPFDLLCHLAVTAPGLTRRQRADRAKKQQAAFFNCLGPEDHGAEQEVRQKLSETRGSIETASAT